jgi:hypothetical protein
MSRPTFDEQRSQPKPCPCGRHSITGGTPLVCPWAPPRVPGRFGAVWADLDAGESE